MLGNGSSERYKLSLVLQRQVAVTSGLVPAVSHCVGWFGNTWVCQRMLLGQGVDRRQGTRSGQWRGSLGGRRSLPLRGTAGRVVFLGLWWLWSIPELWHQFEIVFPPLCVILWEIARYASVLVLLQDFVISQGPGNKVEPSGWDPFFTELSKVCFM